MKWNINNCIYLTQISEKIMWKITFYVFSYKSSCKKFDQERAFPNSWSSNHSKFKLDPFRTEKIRRKGESEWVLTPSCVKTLAPLLIKVFNASRTRLLSVQNFAKYIKKLKSNSKLISLLKSDSPWKLVLLPITRIQIQSKYKCTIPWLFSFGYIYIDLLYFRVN